jgi:hypothetical protein
MTENKKPKVDGFMWWLIIATILSSGVLIGQLYFAIKIMISEDLFNPYFLPIAHIFFLIYIIVVTSLISITLTILWKKWKKGKINQAINLAYVSLLTAFISTLFLIAIFS